MTFFIYCLHKPENIIPESRISESVIFFSDARF